MRAAAPSFRALTGMSDNTASMRYQRRRAGGLARHQLDDQCLPASALRLRAGRPSMMPSLSAEAAAAVTTAAAATAATSTAAAARSNRPLPPQQRAPACALGRGARRGSCSSLCHPHASLAPFPTRGCCDARSVQRKTPCRGRFARCGASPWRRRPFFCALHQVRVVDRAGLCVVSHCCG